MRKRTFGWWLTRVYGEKYPYPRTASCFKFRDAVLALPEAERRAFCAINFTPVCVLIAYVDAAAVAAGRVPHGSWRRKP
jgi:hypothetical protein